MRITKRQLRRIIRESVSGARRTRLTENAISQVELDQILQQHELWSKAKSWIKARIPQGERADLQGADLQGANLQGADLTRINLKDAGLQNANLRRTNLSGADLAGAQLQGADLTNAYIQDANLYNANLEGADVTGAYLRGADLRGARFDANIVNCRNFYSAKFTPNALPWLVLHPKWSEWRDSVRIESMTPNEIVAYAGSDTVIETRLRRIFRNNTR
jgi:uncharacterized protein YjbI with pentapeptide repeats